MRTTITLEPDVAKRLERLRERRRESFKVLVNTALRAGLEALESPPPPRQHFKVEPWSAEILVPDLSNIGELLAYAEGEDYK